MITKVLSAMLLTAIFLPANVLACACCAEPGDYIKHTSSLEDYMLNEVNQITLATSTLYTDAGFPDTIAGIDPIGEDYTVKGSLKGEVWSFELTDEKSRKATINLWRPDDYELFAVDQNPKKETSMVILYKELRFNHRVQSATGFLKNGVDSETNFNLVLQGRGNACTDASNFSTYILQIKGKKARYAFFGNLGSGEDTVMQSQAEERGLTIANQ